MRNSIVSAIFAVLLLTLGFAPGVAVAAPGQPKAAEIIGELRSVTCDGERLEDCRSMASQQLRDHIKERAAAGWSKKKIINEVVATYGGWILLAPPKTGFALWLWATPFALVIGGAVALRVRLALWAKKPALADRPSHRPLKGEDAYAMRVAKELKDFEF